MIKAIGINPGDTWTWAEKAFALYQLHRYEEALTILEMALQINPMDANTIKFREQVLNKLREKGFESGADHV